MGGQMLGMNGQMNHVLTYLSPDQSSSFYPECGSSPEAINR